MVEPGLEATIEETVTSDMTAERIGSGEVAVLGTPAVLALIERAAVRALRGQLDDGRTSVGSEVTLAHLAPTPTGASVRATSRLAEVEGRTLLFEFSVSDAHGEVARGTHRRVIVDRASFTAKANERAG